MFAVLAVVIMFVVLIILVKQNHVRTKQAFQSNDSIKRFKIRQMNYTKTMLISCVATIIFYITPSIISTMSPTGIFGQSSHISTWTRFVSFFNSFNIAILLIYRQNDIRWRLCKIVNVVFRKHLLSVSAIESTNTDHSRMQGNFHIQA
ncbi:hypothetical protein L596_023053 [Steinernema carpocapsae]|uniref:G-protein coupled receptors family 1 profile domain-containing protein n=1 Tax=Steinernema carpocapsae TaxID=34508 RepID=A0A4U5MCG7_STECR|nr:hypothetical protein L596_023053 [Steinernema carpocapsae]